MSARADDLSVASVMDGGLGCIPPLARWQLRKAKKTPKTMNSSEGGEENDWFAVCDTQGLDFFSSFIFLYKQITGTLSFNIHVLSQNNLLGVLERMCYKNK